MTCEECGGEIEVPSMYNDHSFCSPTCLGEWYSNERRKRAKR